MAVDKQKQGVNSPKTVDNEVDLKNSFWLTRILLVRFIGFIYGVAFLVAYHQNCSLIGDKGLTPANLYMERIQQSIGKHDIMSLLNYVPTIFWLCDVSSDNLDYLLNQTALLGVTLSAFLVWKGAGNALIMLTLWVLYHSINSVGQIWYSFGWESQLLESGFITIFLVPLLSTNPIPLNSPPSLSALYCYRWLIFRIMLGAGLIKIRGDKCWRDLTCMNYHYETQPVPNPLSIYFHHLPNSWHQVEVVGNHFVELVAPILLLLPVRSLRLYGGIIQILFQLILIMSGNLSFLNWLTILPSIACLDDHFLKSIPLLALPSRSHDIPKLNNSMNSIGSIIRKLVDLALLVLIGYLSIPVMKNMISTRQVMNTSFDPLKIVNTYGAFGSITKTRYEVIIQGTSDVEVTSNTQWLEYEFKCKPGSIVRRPCTISPYHYRLDWLMWFAAFSQQHQQLVLIPVSEHLLKNSLTINNLISYNPFNNTDPPRWIRHRLYKYQFTYPDSTDWIKGHWWRRRFVREVIPPINKHSLH